MYFEPAEIKTIEMVAKLREAVALELILYVEYDAEQELQLDRNVVMQRKKWICTKWKKL